MYQRERFPVVGHGLLIAAFSFCAVSFSHVLRGAPGLPSAAGVAVAFVSCFIFFLQLRIADEFKDLEEDTRWRPYRAVPRGLVTLRELAVVFVVGAVLQLLLALLLSPRLLLLLAVTWVYLAAMSKEFFVRRWLAGRPMLYMLSHMMIMPLIDLYATGTDWAPVQAVPPAGLGWFLAASFFNGMVIEIGRKIRSRADEEPGVNTYTAVWGRTRATLAWLGVLGLTGVCATLAAARVDAAVPVLALLAFAYAAAILTTLRFLAADAPGANAPGAGGGKWFECVSGVWTLVVYLSLGILPLLLR